MCTYIVMEGISWPYRTITKERCYSDRVSCVTLRVYSLENRLVHVRFKQGSWSFLCLGPNLDGTSASVE